MMLHAFVVSVLLSCACAAVIYPQDHFDNDEKLSDANVKSYNDHCNGLNCPTYKVLKKGDGWELREYGPSEWVTSRTTGIDYKAASRTNFRKLYKYISGENDQKVKITMTAPVITHITITQGPFCASDFLMHFFVPPHSASSPTPTPTEKGLKIVKYPTTKVYVKSYGGFSNLEKIQKNGEALIAALQKEKLSFGEKDMMYAGYDSPFKLFERHNEVMVFAKDASAKY